MTRPTGYELRLGTHRLDVLEFRRLVRQGQQAAAENDHEATVERLSAALALWRGPALANVADELVAGQRQALHEERLAAAEALLEAQLVLARHEEILRVTPALRTENPYRERVYELEMLALAATGRRAEALELHRRLRRRLIDDLGIEPSPAVAELQQRILDGAPPSRPPQARPVMVPRQLPPIAGPIVGRDKLLGEIRAELGRGDHGAPPVVTLVGPGGVGKSSLALCVGHELAETYVDGQLHADLRGSRERPADPYDVLGRFLRALSVPGSAIPDDREERMALYRSRLADRRVLVVLDDAADEEQVRPLLPGTASCAALVTARGQLAALVGAARWTVPGLSPADSQELLARRVGIERVTAEPDAAIAIVEAVGQLPLAVTIAAARLAARPYWTLGEFATRLADERGRLDELVVGDLDVRASIGLSYRALSAEARLVFRRLGLVAAVDWPGWVVQALAGRPARLLDPLVQVHLVEPRGRDAAGQPRFRLHDLVADFARERAHAEDGPAECAAAVARLLSTWLALATEADELVSHGQVSAVGLASPAPPDDATAQPVRDSPAAWFEAERPALAAAVEQACDVDEPDLAARLALRLAGFLASRGYGDDSERVLSAAVAAARGRVDDSVLARLLNALLTVFAQRARNAALAALTGELATLAHQLGDHRLEARALGYAGLAARRAGRLHDAATLYDSAITSCTTGRIEDTTFGAALLDRAQLHSVMGDHDLAVATAHRAVVLDREHAVGPRLAIGLSIYGEVLLQAGRLDDAERLYVEAGAITRELGHNSATSIIERCLGQIDTRRGRWRAAAVRLAGSLRFHEEHGDADDVANTLDVLGELAISRGTPTAAIAPLQRSLELWRHLGEPVESARTLALLGTACAAIGDEDAAADHHRERRRILTDLGLNPT